MMFKSYKKKKDPRGKGLLQRSFGMELAWAFYISRKVGSLFMPTRACDCHYLPIVLMSRPIEGLGVLKSQH
jgi:hypothetical protein